MRLEQWMHREGPQSSESFLHRDFDSPTLYCLSLSLLQLLIKVHPEGLDFQDMYGNTSLHHAGNLHYIDCLRAFLYSGNVEAPATQNMFGETPLHWSMEYGSNIPSNVSLATLWEFLCYNHKCVAIQNNDGMTALQPPPKNSPLPFLARMQRQLYSR